MALIYKLKVSSGLDFNNRPCHPHQISSSIHFSVMSVLKKIERTAKVDGWRRFNLQTVQVDIPGIGDSAGALDDSGPGFKRFKETIDV